MIYTKEKEDSHDGYESYETVSECLGSLDGNKPAPMYRFDSNDMAIQTLDSKLDNSGKLTKKFPLLKGNLLFAVLSTFATYPLNVAAQRSQARKVNTSSDSKRVNYVPNQFIEDFEPMNQTVMSILRTKGLHSLYRGFPLFLIQQMLSSKIKEWTTDVIKEVRLLGKKPKNGVMKVNSFHRHLAYYLNFRKELSFQKSLSIDTLAHDDDSDEDEDSVLVEEVIALVSELVSLSCTYPLLTIAMRQMVADDDSGYTMTSMFNVSRTLDEGFSWCYRGIQYNILRSLLRTSGRIAMNYIWNADEEDSSVNSMVMRESSKIFVNMFLSPLEVLSDLEKLKSNVPGLMDDTADMMDMLEVCMPPRYRWTIGITCLAIPAVTIIERWNSPRLVKTNGGKSSESDNAVLSASWLAT